jgi:hypothetical protein
MIFSTFSQRRYLSLIVLLFAFILGACNNSSPRSTTTEVENPESQALKLIINTSDIPGKWSWEKAFVHQSSKAEELTQADIIDRASSFLIGDYWLRRKQYYIWIIHRVAQYGDETPRVEDSSLQSAFGDEGHEINPPNLQSFGDRMSTKCFNADPFLDCTVVVSYQFIESRLTIIVPKGLGFSELENLINAILIVNDNKITNVSIH